MDRFFAHGRDSLTIAVCVCGAWYNKTRSRERISCNLRSFRKKRERSCFAKYDETSSWLGLCKIQEGRWQLLPSKYSSGFHMATEEEDDQSGKEYLEKEMWTAGYKSRPGGRWRRQHRTELKMDKNGLWPTVQREWQGKYKSRERISKDRSLQHSVVYIACRDASVRSVIASRCPLLRFAPFSVVYIAPRTFR